MTILHFVDFGPRDAQPVVFLGSIASTTDMWLPQLDSLSKDFRVIAIDHPGHGQSPDPQALPGETTINDLANNVLNTLDALGVDEFAIVGLSLGGAIAQYLTATSGRVTKAVFMCTASYFGGPDKWAPRAEETRAEGMETRARGAIELWLTPEYRASHPALTDALTRMIMSTRGEGYAVGADALAGWDYTEELSNITVPVLTISGAVDPSTPPEVVHAIAEHVGGEAESITLSSGGHVPTVEVPEEVTRALRTFLSA
ncbi:alpha/beta fold hydrolase [Corynebacterium imitans]|uniref:alpha/beta fold hydrolase n=1 Tax=Corynebacterium imitans TaxID=156978 RepID=UPI00254B98A6|nr:alpha/beta fold hydrolase [Corynebacterium imitans]MDK8306653.1 alpha/beta fold hydrolase [Corynebacterium imitans]MDK8638040.1 alpha/beta fold hydrolase [Corynebacterium imitans]MDK8773060.1 alpha/beta fold hydrolase [Corynebacterium imitans]